MVPNMTSCRGGVGSATLGKQNILSIFSSYHLPLIFKVVVSILLVDMMVQHI
jgi:hypothetical protein